MKKRMSHNVNRHGDDDRRGQAGTPIADDDGDVLRLLLASSHLMAILSGVDLPGNDMGGRNGVTNPTGSAEECARRCFDRWDA